jgi:hypothetical protein
MHEYIRRRMRILAAASLAVPACSTLASGQARTGAPGMEKPDTIGCTGEWREQPTPGLESLSDHRGRSAALYSPSAVRTARGLYVTGNVQFPREHWSHTAEAALIGPDGTAMTLPKGANEGRGLRLAVSAPDTLYLLWGIRSAEADTSNGGSRFVNELWFASRAGRAAWTQPTRLYLAEKIRMDDTDLHDMVHDGTGTFHLVFAAQRYFAETNLVHVRMRAGRATVTAIELRGGAGYVDAVPTASGLLVAFVAPDVTKPRNANSVFVIDVDDRGFHAPARLVMSSPGQEQAFALRAVSTADGAIHLVWVEARPAEPPLLRHTVSRDGGKTWSPWHDAPYNGDPHFALTPAGSAGVAAYYTVWTQADRSHSEMRCWDESWHSAQRFGGGLRLWDPHPVLSADSRRSMVATAVMPTVPETFRTIWLDRTRDASCRPGRRDAACGP